jgi:hypothetical protein
MPAISPEDRFAIQDLFARYAWAIDTEDWQGYTDCFTSDAVLEMPAGRFHGHTEIYDYVKNRDMWLGSQHYFGQVLVEKGDAERAFLRSYSQIVYRRSDGSCGFRVLGIYEDTCVRTARGWLFAERLWERWDPDRTDNYRIGRRKDAPAARS